MYVGVCVLQCSGCPDGIQIYTDPAVSQEGHNIESHKHTTRGTLFQSGFRVLGFGCRGLNA